jgi:hypothetical protein
MLSFTDAVHQRLTRLLSLSERAIRALSAIAVGASTLLTETMFPEVLRGTTTYQVTIGMIQQYIIEQVAGMENEVTENLVEIGDDFVQRKMVGTALEAAGLLMMRFSPLWVFAIAGDAAGGTKVYLNRLVEQLKVNGVIAEETEVKELVGVLKAVQQASRQSASAVDMPPLSREELSALADDMKASYSRAFKQTADLMPQLDDLWERMELLISRENISMERLGGLMTVEAASWSHKSAGIVQAVGQTGAELFDEKILESYRKTLAAASKQGVNTYVSDHMKPFLQTARSHFDSDRTTWIERKLRRNKEISE